MCFSAITHLCSPTLSAFFFGLFVLRRKKDGREAGVECDSMPGKMVPAKAAMGKGKPTDPTFPPTHAQKWHFVTFIRKLQRN